MFRILTAAVAATFLFVAPAFARHCPTDAAAINAALEKVQVSDEEKAAIIDLRDRGLQAHAAGDHPTAEALLADAMRRLLMAL